MQLKNIECFKFSQNIDVAVLCSSDSKGLCWTVGSMEIYNLVRHGDRFEQEHISRNGRAATFTIQIYLSRVNIFADIGYEDLMNRQWHTWGVTLTRCRSILISA